MRHLNVLIAATAISALGAAAQTPAQESPVVDETASSTSTTDLLNFGVFVRVDYQHQWNEGETVDANSGFEGKYFMFMANGEILPGLTYSWRQKLNRDIIDSNFFDATDWIYLAYRYKRFDVSVGKQLLALGGFEYDHFPLDLYSTSLFWDNLPPFQLAVNGGVSLGTNDHLTAQIAQSPYAGSGNRNMYAYSLRWEGNHSWYKALWSVDLLEYAKNKYISYIVLGNRFEAGPAALELDLVNRAASHQTFLFKDASVIAKLMWNIDPRWRVHAKYTYDVNRSGNDADLVVLPGTELSMIGGGVEYFPLRTKRHDMRLHANCYYSWGENTNTASVMQRGTTMFDVGVTWHMDVFSVKHK